jgi:glycosyltransferase involved in cell wall biosynthesis
MKDALAQLLDEQEFDVVQIESIHLMSYLPIFRAAANPPKVICDWHNIESELMRRYSEREATFLRRAYARKTVRQLNAVEKQATRDFDGHIVVSQRDREQLLKLNPAASICVIENGVDSDYYSDSQIEKAHASWIASQERKAAVGDSIQSPIKPNRIVFVGSMDYHANIEGIVAFAREVWPAFHQHHPHLVFTIVGRDPAAEVRQLAAIAGVEVTGTVADVRPYYREALAAIVPLRVGGGSRLKILEAMAAGVPVVSTALGAEGLEVEHGENILVADINMQFLDTITRVVENQELRRQLGEAGRALVASRYDWEMLGTSLFKIYENLLAAQAT